MALRDNESRIAAAFIYLAGLAAFAWNSYQNQKPHVIVPYDFWDSKTFFWGYWVTRVYKLYLFGWLLPYIAMIHVAILVVTLRFVRRARKAGKLVLSPFHPDGVGGLDFLASIISAPISATLVVGSLSTATAFLVHRAANVTPLIALGVLIAWAIVAYFVPIFFLRSDIVAMKQELLGKLRNLQQANYTEINEGHSMDLDVLSKGKEALDYFDNVCEKIKTISNYPHIKRLVGSLGFAVSTSVISITLKLFDIAPMLGRLLLKR